MNRDTLRLALGAASLTAAASVFASPAVASPLGDVAPHRAVYDMTLADVSNGADLASLDGRLVYDLQGAPCEGFTVNFRLVTRFTTERGDETVTDMRSSTFEEALDLAAGSGRFRFLTRNLVDAVAADETSGTAERGEEGTQVALTKPGTEPFDIARDVMFPTEHLGRLLEAAKAGETVFQARIYDGSEDGATVNETTAVIGARETSRMRDDFPRLSDQAYWPVTLSYYDEGETGDQLPSYEISFDLYANGVSDGLTLDYGAFRVSGALSSLDVSETPACD